ncbi:hypothetical protein [uncultured Mediterranean phage]|nr:hypothetical protein [uncultured Mediterranean phage]
MTNKIEPILDFIVLDEEQGPVVDERGIPSLKQRPIVKSIPDLIAKGKVQNIEMFAEQFAQVEQWDWAEQYIAYLISVHEVEQHNANLPTYVNNEGEEVEALPLELPEEPERPPIQTPTEVLEPYQKQITKTLGIEFKGVHVSLNESNQNGLSALKSALELSKEFEVDDQFFPINFNAETCTGTKILMLADEAEFKQFGLQFIMARKVFFE